MLVLYWGTGIGVLVLGCWYWGTGTGTGVLVLGTSTGVLALGSWDTGTGVLRLVLKVFRRCGVNFPLSLASSAFAVWMYSGIIRMCTFIHILQYPACTLVVLYRYSSSSRSNSGTT